jgi:hypothetical protein
LIRKRCFCALIACTLILGLPCPSQADGLTIEYGVGYDFLSQEYSWDTSFVAGAEDTLLENWSREREYSNSFKHRLALRLDPLADHRLRINAVADVGLELDFLRPRLSTDFKTALGPGRLDWHTDSELRTQSDDFEGVGTDYVRFDQRLRWQLGLSSSLTSLAQIRAEWVDFSSENSFGYDYHRLEARLGLERAFALLSYLRADIFLATREVDTSLNLDYMSLGSDISFLGLYDWGDLDALARLESRDYDQPDDEGDYWLFDGDFRGRIKISQRLFTRISYEAECLHYRAADDFSRNYSRNRGTALIGGELGPVTLSAGPQLEYVAQEELEGLGDETYLEPALQAGFQFSHIGGSFWDIEAKVGSRQHRTESDLFTDFKFLRITSIGDQTVYGGLSFDMLFSSEWEYHETEVDDSKLFLLSTKLTWTF